MQINLSSLKHFKKAFLASLIMLLLISMFLMAMLPFSSANEGVSTMQAPDSGTIPTIDGKWGVGEWDDALEYRATNLTLTSYVRVKWSGSFLYILIDSPWDTTNSSVFPYENTWIAFDTMHNHGSAPKTDDYLFTTSMSFYLMGWVGTGTSWNQTSVPGFQAESSSSDWGPGVQPSPKNSTPHRIDEFKVPLTYVGQINQTGGFYFMVVDDIDDPDGPGDLASPTYVEWPENSGGRSDGWPLDGRDPCPAPSAWGHLTLLQRPTAAFTWGPPNPDVGEIVTFNATDSQDDGSIVNFTWDFGDGNVTAVSTPLINHTFSAAGRYTVDLTVTDNDGLNGSIVHTVKVGVVADFTFSPPTPNPGDVVTFNATDSYSAGRTIANYTWNFDDGNVTTVDAPVITHTFSTGGSYAVNLTVTDNATRMAWVVHTVNVGVPVANFTFWPSKPNARDSIIFDATASSDPDGIASYTWNWGDTSSNITTNPIITHAFSSDEIYTVNLTVTDNLGLNGSFARTVTVYAPREARFSFSPSTPNVGDPVIFNASLSKDPGGTIANYTWDWGDISSNVTTNPIIVHIFSTNGSYNVNLTITDNDGLKSWYNNTVNVGIPPVQATAPYSPMIPYVDGIWSSGEWNDANDYIINGTGGEGYILVKWGSGNITGNFLYILVNSPWDTTPPTLSSKENTWTAFDTEHDKSTVGPQPDDYLFNSEYSSWQGISWQGNGTGWTSAHGLAPNFLAAQSNSSGHRIDEIRIPLAFVGTVGQTSGFHVIVVDDSSDPDRKWGPDQPPTDWVEWPAGAGGNSAGWPVAPDYIDPSPTLDKWGYLFLEPLMKTLSNVTLDISASSITIGESVTISGTVFNSTDAIAWVNVTIQSRSTGTTEWTNITTVITSTTGAYMYSWKPAKAGTYEIKAVWAGDATNYGAESEVKTLKVASEPIPILMIVAALAVVAFVVAIAMYLLKVRKPKR